MDNKTRIATELAFRSVKRSLDEASASLDGQISVQSQTALELGTVGAINAEALLASLHGTFERLHELAQQLRDASSAVEAEIDRLDDLNFR